MKFTPDMLLDVALRGYAVTTIDHVANQPT